MVHYSTVVGVHTPADLKSFERVLAALPHHSLQAKRTTLEKSVVETQATKVLLTLK